LATPVQLWWLMISHMTMFMRTRRIRH